MTLVTRTRGNWFVVPSECIAILESFEFCRAKTELNCLGFVLMPDHLHALLVQEKEFPQVPKLIQDFKKFTSRKLRPALYVGEALWQDRYDDVPVPTHAIDTKINYMYKNPIRGGLVEHIQDYQWSSVGVLFDNYSCCVQITVY